VVARLTRSSYPAGDRSGCAPQSSLPQLFLIPTAQATRCIRPHHPGRPRTSLWPRPTNGCDKQQIALLIIGGVLIDASRWLVVFEINQGLLGLLELFGLALDRSDAGPSLVLRSTLFFLSFFVLCSLPHRRTGTSQELRLWALGPRRAPPQQWPRPPRRSRLRAVSPSSTCRRPRKRRRPDSRFLDSKRLHQGGCALKCSFVFGDRSVV